MRTLTTYLQFIYIFISKCFEILNIKILKNIELAATDENLHSWI